MRQVVVWLLCAIFACLSAVCRASLAASAGLGIPSGVNLAVERGPGAEDCLDATALNARIAAIRGHDDTRATTVYVVGFKRTGTAFSAAIRVGGTGLRVLSARGQSCVALGQATAVTLAMLIDSDEASPPRALSATEPQATPPVKHPPALPLRAPPPPSAALAGGIGVGAAALVGVLGPVAPALAAEGELGTGRVRAGVGVLWGLPRSISLAPGSIRESLLAGTLRGCLGIAGDRAFRLDVCLGAFAGATTGEARGFTSNLEHRRPWLVLPVELSLARLSGPVGWELTGSALAALVEHDFAIDGVGVASRSSPVGGMLSLRGSLIFLP